MFYLLQAGSLLAAGCRDHSVYLLDLTKFTTDHPDNFDKLVTRIDAHKVFYLLCVIPLWLICVLCC